MKIVFFGTPQFAVPSLERLLTHSEFDVVAVVTQPDKRRGRGSKVTPSPVKATIQERAPDCPLWQPARIKQDADTLRQLDSLQADAFVVIAYGQILSQEMLDMPRLGCVNAHGSLLPEYRGAAPIQWCIHDGKTETGVTTMLMDAGMDTGPMLIEETIPIGLFDTAWQVAENLALLSADLLPVTLTKLHQQMIRPIPQNDEQATYAPLIQKIDYQLDWQKSAKEIHDKVRGFYPSCVAQFREGALKVMATAPLSLGHWQSFPEDCFPEDCFPEGFGDIQARYEDLDIDTVSPPGTVVAILKNAGPVVQTGNGHLLLRTVKPAGKKALSGWDFANGSRVEVGETLLDVSHWED